MLEIILLILSVIFLVTPVVIYIAVADAAYSAEEKEAVKKKRKYVAAVMLVGLTLLVVSMSLRQINAGEVGVLKRFGAVVNEDTSLAPGLHIIMPISDNVEKYNTKQSVYETSDVPNESKADYTDIAVNTMTRDGQTITLKFSVVFHIDPSRAGWIAQNIGNESDVVEKVVKANTRSEVRNIPKSFTAAALYGEDLTEPSNRQDVYDCQAALFESLSKTFAENGVILDEFLLRKIDFSPELVDALEAKQIALENQVTQQRNVEVKKAEAEQALEVANGEAAAKLALATAEAESIRLIQVQLAKSPSYIQYVLAKGIADGTTEIEYAILPEGSTPFVSLGANWIPQAIQE